MKPILYIIFPAFTLFGCNSYKNKEKYEIKVGETVEIYSATNSCCFYCHVSKDQYKHLKFIEGKTVDKGNKMAEGNTVTTAWIFKAESIGKDTVVLRHLYAADECDSSDAVPEMYIIEVKE